MHLFLDVSQPHCMIHGYSFASQNSQPPVDMRRAMLSHIILLEFKISSGAGEFNDPLGLSSQDEASIQNWFSRAMTICERAKALPIESGVVSDSKGVLITVPGGLAKLYRESKLADIVLEIDPNCTIAPRRSEYVEPNKLTDPPGSPRALSDNSQKRNSQKSNVIVSENSNLDDVRSDVPQPSGDLDTPLSFGQHAPLAPDLKVDIHNYGSQGHSFTWLLSRYYDLIIFVFRQR